MCTRKGTISFLPFQFNWHSFQEKLSVISTMNQSWCSVQLMWMFQIKQRTFHDHNPTISNVWYFVRNTRNQTFSLVPFSAKCSANLESSCLHILSPKEEKTKFLKKCQWCTSTTDRGNQTFLKCMMKQLNIMFTITLQGITMLIPACSDRDTFLFTNYFGIYM